MMDTVTLKKFLEDYRKSSMDAASRCHETFESKDYYEGIEHACTRILEKINEMESDDA